MYTTDPNDGKKQVPKARPQGAYGKVTQPGPQVLSARPNYVLINNTGQYLFLYSDSGSYPGDYVSGSIVTSGGPVRLDINPKAWGSKTGVTGDVTFVYTGDVG
jgi:hypothetical protein